jgi:hypothetical protein
MNSWPCLCSAILYFLSPAIFYWKYFLTVYFILVCIQSLCNSYQIWLFNSVGPVLSKVPDVRLRFHKYSYEWISGIQKSEWISGSDSQNNFPKLGWQLIFQGKSRKVKHGICDSFFRGSEVP